MTPTITKILQNPIFTFPSSWPTLCMW